MSAAEHLLSHAYPADARLVSIGLKAPANSQMKAQFKLECWNDSDFWTRSIVRWWSASPDVEGAYPTHPMSTGKHLTIVFTYSGESIEQVSTAAWYEALKRAVMEEFRSNDLRRT